MVTRRDFFGTVPLSALALSIAGTLEPRTAVAVESQDSGATAGVIASPPVVQHPRRDSFGVSVAVNQLATAWVEYGWEKDQLTYTAIASQHGLVQASDRALHIRVVHPEPLPTDRPIYYRVVAQSLAYQNAYSLKRGETQASAIYSLRLPAGNADSLRIVVVNDTHENLATIQALHREIDKLAPDLLLWNGDTCNDFDRQDSPAQIVLNPAQDLGQAWASERPLIFCCGNHDVRGERARELTQCLPGCPEQTGLPYCQAFRWGPLALLTLDTGEDKPDHHPVFAGTAAYEPYRRQQATWLKEVLSRADIREAPFKIVACHIPLRGLPGDPDGTTLNGAANHCGFGAQLWLPILKEAGVQAIISGHMHQQRLDAETPQMPIAQFVGGGPRPEQATLMVIDVKSNGDAPQLKIRLQNLDQQVLQAQQWG